MSETAEYDIDYFQIYILWIKIIVMINQSSHNKCKQAYKLNNYHSVLIVLPHIAL